MNYSVVTIPPFDRQLKRLIKKYPSLKKEIAELGELLADDPTFGTSLGNSCYKIRISIASKRKGKSGGARVITHVYIENELVYLIAIYDKSEEDNISDKELSKLLKLIN
jgi:mRNA-degrading endonuclease RelE of RelBE toxin-antitoxin system